MGLLLLISVLPLSEARAATSVTLAWDAVTDPGVTGYTVYWGTASRTYPWSQVLGAQTSFLVPDLQEGVTYYFAVKSRNDGTGQSSDFSVELPHTVPVPSNQPPSATANGNPLSGRAPLSVSFSGSGVDADGTVVSYSWNFGDGSSSSQQNPSHVYSSAGTYSAQLIVTDNQGAVGTSSVPITVVANQLPTAAAGGAPTTGRVPLNVAFTGSGTDSDGSVAGFSWSFGDGASSTLQSPSHTYGSPGAYTARLTVTDNEGGTNTATVGITVLPPNQPPTASASAAPATGAAPLTVSFTGTGTDPDGAISSYSWSFGDGSSSSTQHPTHIYHSPGIYAAVLTVRDNEGAMATQSLDVQATLGGGGSRNRVIAGLGSFPTQGGLIDFFSEEHSHEFWLKLGWPEYVAASGEARVATGDIDGDGRHEVILGLGPAPGNPGLPGGRFQVLDDDWNHLAWGQVSWPEYNGVNGETWPACGDVDGDGKDEILIGLGAGGGGKIEVFGFESGNLVHKGWVTVNWPDYNSAHGEARPALGDVDGDGWKEIVVGLGRVPGSIVTVEGSFQLLDRSANHMAWGLIDWPEYRDSGGENWPAVADVDGDGKGEILIGLGPGGGGKVEVFGFQSGGLLHRGWVTITWAEYADLFGATRPGAGDLDQDGIAEVIVGLGTGGNGWIEVFDDSTEAFAPWFHLQMALDEYNSTNGETWVAVMPLAPGPTLASLGASPNPTSGAATVTLTATADNTAGSGTVLGSAEWWLDPREGPGFPMAASDGAFDLSAEEITATIDVSPWPPGNYTLVARAKDAGNRWGASASVVLSIGLTGDTILIKKARYRKKKLVVAATSDAQSGTVTLETKGYGAMQYQKRKKVFKGVFRNVPTKPATVTVESSGGGSRTVPVQ